MGLVAGGTGAFCGCPADVALVRMTVDFRLPEAERRNYRFQNFPKINFISMLIF